MPVNFIGHPTPRLNFIDVATGSLGQGLSVACGMAYVGKFIDKASYRTYCLMGDGESMEVTFMKITKDQFRTNNFLTL